MPRQQTTLEAEVALQPGPPADRHVASAPVAIEVTGLSKGFRVPGARDGDGVLRALRDVSFEVHRGEFFGIVGRNGSGKSTLLKLLSSIYRADAGRIRMAGRLAPFIELGVGFDTELTARENVVINGVMMGLGRREAARRLDAILDFAELGSFVDLKLKNYSSGMLVRLAFASMVEAGADVMLVDEVLAVGDAAFAQKCIEVFRAKRDAGATIVLVTHDMATVQTFCDRALLLHDGAQRFLGDPDEAARRYYRLNFGTDGSAPAAAAELVDAWVEGPDGVRTDVLPEDGELHLQVVLEAREELHDANLGLRVLREDGVAVCGFGVAAPEVVPAGRRVRVSTALRERLAPGAYQLEVTMSRGRAQGDLAFSDDAATRFSVAGRWIDPASAEDRDLGLVRVANDISAVRVAS